ncbi:Hermansky-Pudlak syndrome 6 protein [Trematomus bernacchii]|uniref:Hermansky-Pudlak syndrome 6 protein n=1 Tax=Trematomus bernacchii TaxID=40690 RepID=UPI00146E512E|nr:Hermansky-Pudlak syndrome 6 protein [Trematomus bernacchii]
MARLVLEQLSDFGDYTGGKELTEIFKLTNNNDLKNSLSNVRLSPDGRHVHVILRKPKVGLVTFDKYERPHVAQNQKKLDLRLAVPIVDILYLDHNNNSSSSSSRGTAVVAVVYENGKAEFWKFQECKAGWHLLQTSDLCNSPRAKVVSVCACSNLIIWCEERPPSESTPALSSTRNKLRYCVCRRDFEVEEGAVGLGGVKIALHNNPKFTVVSSGEYVHLLPDVKVKPQLSISKFFLSWSPRHDTFTVSTTCNNTPLKKLSAKESDLKRLVTDCLGYLSTLQPPEIYDFSPTGCGGLLLLLSTGWVCLLQKDGTLRQVYKLAENCMVKCGTPQTSLCMYQDTLALLMGQNLHLIDVNCGREMEKITLKKEGLLYVNRAERCAPHLLSETGLFVVVNREMNSRDVNNLKPFGVDSVESIHPGELLVEAVFEEACKYYQQRSLSSTQLTVDTLKKGGRFQAPISLSTILRNYLSTGLRQKGAEPLQNGDDNTAGQDKLMGSLEAELKALVSLEEVKGSLVRGNVKEVEAVCQSLVEKEVARLMLASEMDKEALLYLNSIFSLFPSQAWRAAQAALQLHYNGEGSLSSRASPDVWKTVLSPATTSSPPSSLPFTNGGPKHNHSLKGDHVANCKSKISTSPADMPVFELLCYSVFHFQPSWLPRFLELAQQQQGSAGLGLGLASSSSWGFSGGRAGEGGENNMPLYKRALAALSSLTPDRDKRQDLEVELLLVSGRPNAILQALRTLMAKQQWERVTMVAQKFCKQSPLLNKEIFTTLLCEVAQHRDLDPYLDVLWALCPEDLTVTTILNLVLKNLPSPNTPPSSSSSSSFSMSSTTSSSPAPFADSHSSQLTIGLLKPLLKKVLQRETKPSQRYADILQSPTFPPPAPPRQPRTVSDPNTDSSLANDTTPGYLAETHGQQSPTHTAVQRARVALPANPV